MVYWLSEKLIKRKLFMKKAIDSIPNSNFIQKYIFSFKPIKTLQYNLLSTKPQSLRIPNIDIFLMTLFCYCNFSASRVCIFGSKSV